MTTKRISIKTDSLTKKVWRSLARDFDLEGELSEALYHLDTDHIKDFRSSMTKEFGIVDPYRFKVYTQMANLLKKYRFEHDVYDEQELCARTLDGYLGTQTRLAEHMLTPDPWWVQAVTSEARKIARSILGKIEDEDIMKHARFGRKASIGCPLKNAYIDHKLIDEGAFTSSCYGWSWFRRYLETDTHLAAFFEGRSPRSAKSLELQMVPKTWKIHRLITPLPLIDLFYTFGVGKLAEERLAHSGLSLSRLPTRHRRLVRLNSNGGYLATGDLSAASDSMTSLLLNRVLPRDWFTAIKRAFFRTVTYEGRCFHTMSVLPMGNGFTFPIETVVFYCLLRAIQNLTGIPGLISVFGDDLIYPVRMHHAVSVMFQGLGFVMNLDKTFASYPFRESCGEDFYRGFPVRPCLLGNPDHRELSGGRLHTHIYKVVNVLLRRWDYHEIPGTIDMLLSIINYDGAEILRVPPSFPDQSGLKVAAPTDVCGRDCQYKPVTVRFAHGSRWYEFSYHHLVYKRRNVIAQEPYYWLSLAGRDDSVDDHWTNQWSLFAKAPRSNLSWQRFKRRPITLPNGKKLKRKPKSIPVVPSRILRNVGVKDVLVSSRPAVAGRSDWHYETSSHS